MVCFIIIIDTIIVNRRSINAFWFFLTEIVCYGALITVLKFLTLICSFLGDRFKILFYVIKPENVLAGISKNNFSDDVDFK